MPVSDIWPFEREIFYFLSHKYLSEGRLIPSLGIFFLYILEGPATIKCRGSIELYSILRTPQCSFIFAVPSAKRFFVQSLARGSRKFAFLTSRHPKNKYVAWYHFSACVRVSSVVSSVCINAKNVYIRIGSMSGRQYPIPPPIPPHLTHSPRTQA